MERLRLKRAYEEPDPGDGVRVLVDRLWPRGVRKDAAAIDVWLKGATPSVGLREWFCHDAALFGEFRKRYLKELEGLEEGVLEPVLGPLREGRVVTLVYGAKDEVHNHAVVLAEFLRKRE